ncbi:MAG: hypothetical protein HYZ49_10995 [Chloroflexi bacterium]|nr:hypothetical protein [Chloroflexota bacterium]
MTHKRLFSFLILLGLVFAGGLTSGCSAPQEHELMMASLDQMPPEVQNEPERTRQAYQFAVANPDVMQHIPCYCGCDNLGHTNNYVCYVAGVDAAGIIKFDSHAIGCPICVDITQDAMKMLRQGKSTAEIKTYIDTMYAKYGPSNMPAENVP